MSRGNCSTGTFGTVRVSLSVRIFLVQGFSYRFSLYIGWYSVRWVLVLHYWHFKIEPKLLDNNLFRAVALYRFKKTAASPRVSYSRRTTSKIIQCWIVVNQPAYHIMNLSSVPCCAISSAKLKRVIIWNPSCQFHAVFEVQYFAGLYQMWFCLWLHGFGLYRRSDI